MTENRLEFMDRKALAMPNSLLESEGGSIWLWPQAGELGEKPGCALPSS